MDGAGDGEAVLRLVVVQRVAAGDDAARLGDLLRAAAHDLAEDRRVERLRERRDVERHQHLAAHRVDVAHGVRRGDRAERVRVVDDGREEVDRLDDRQVVGQAVDGGVVGAVEPDEEVGERRGVERLRDRRDDVGQRRERGLAGAAGARCERCQADRFAGGHG